MHPLQSNPTTPIVLSIAGSDSGGGAGIQADLKTISATGSYACSVITAITAQNTLGVSAVYPVPREQVSSQLEAVFSDIHIDVVKIGMLAEASIIEAVSEKIAHYKPKYVVLDPVLVSSSGKYLLNPKAISCLKDRLIPLVDLLTPNLPESVCLTGGGSPNFNPDITQLGEDLLALGATSVLLKGGHMEERDRSCDWLFHHGKIEQYCSKRVMTKNSHGTGCTLSSAISSYLAQGYPLTEAVRRAKAYLFKALKTSDALKIGHGTGPLNHFHTLTV
ncbi:bifunctional hydroxymethylpyrimidine kinase/phosphomethylpyrimidine kinase [Vibrio sp. S4M6]|uniref:bifunctional hydroxymethylpyrimidine kinase/phosphomethylpyrimidine kinase n=1 Tax=Vibrio sinus TaxID=2946865 RepID=UPI002029E054|nr:bifunctional hydroxymethylpyrimidine kinase/phosphomethylpyrimidine kinase [Vibrio sinus]MCL9781657.1 bifunctional hydroxymethylpyrimidine kinase/phosphomethylpyrimidine kinase [Vibrio sinus]